MNIQEKKSENYTIEEIKKYFVRSGIWTHAYRCRPEDSFYMSKIVSLESGALDRSAILTYEC